MRVRLVTRTDPKPLRVKSPCVNVCVMDEHSGYCRGCKRTLDEIAAWGAASDADRLVVLAAIPARQLVRPQITPPPRD